MMFVICKRDGAENWSSTGSASTLGDALRAVRELLTEARAHSGQFDRRVAVMEVGGGVDAFPRVLSRFTERSILDTSTGRA